MYLVNTELTVNWILRATIYDIPIESLDIVIKPPKGSGNVQYINNAIIAENYVKPTVSSDGIVSYKFTPDSIGMWEIILTDGTEDINKLYYGHRLFIDEAETFTQKFIPSNLL